MTRGRVCFFDNGVTAADRVFRNQRNGKQSDGCARDVFSDFAAAVRLPAIHGKQSIDVESSAAAIVGKR